MKRIRVSTQISTIEFVYTLYRWEKNRTKHTKSYYGFISIIHSIKSLRLFVKIIYLGAIINIGVFLKSFFFSSFFLGNPAISTYLWKCFIKTTEIFHCLFAHLSFCPIKQYWKTRNFSGNREMKWVHSQTENNEVTVVHCDRYYKRGTYSGKEENKCPAFSGVRFCKDSRSL